MRLQTSGLVASYSFLLPNVDTNGSSMVFNSLNDAGDAGYLNAQILGSDPSAVFLSGVSIPKLKVFVSSDLLYLAQTKRCS